MTSHSCSGALLDAMLRSGERSVCAAMSGTPRREAESGVEGAARRVEARKRGRRASMRARCGAQQAVVRGRRCGELVRLGKLGGSGGIHSLFSSRGGNGRGVCGREQMSVLYLLRRA